MTPNEQHGDVSGKRSALQDVGPFVGIGTSLAATVLLSLWAGHALDDRYGTEPRYFLLGAAFGLLAAIYHFYRMYKRLEGGRKK